MNNMSTTDIPPSIAELTGPLFIGHLFNWALFGALTVQTYLYYVSFPKDKLLPKLIVTTCYTLEVLQTTLSTRDAFRNFGTGWGSMAELDTVGWLWFSVPVMGSIICSLGQLFYAWRIWILSRSCIVASLVVSIAMVQLGMGTYCGAHAAQVGHFSELQATSFKPTAVWLVSAAANDVIIAVCMIYFLRKSNTGFHKTSTLLTKFIRITCETGLVCATFAVLDIAFFVRWQNNNYHLAPSIPLSKLYSNSLLVVLNARIKIVGGRNEYKSEARYSGDLSYLDGSQISTPSCYGQSNNSSKLSRLSRFTATTANNISVTVSQEVHTAGEIARSAKQARIPMVVMEDVGKQNTHNDDIKQKFDVSPLDDISPETVARINKSAQLI
ncbi:hypothetical protein BDW22DRAFT_856452 [Trametopsis cervina]|nr:hypothetical protein BDW22DRAFT_856452 [Trametopsis cervina]